MSAKQSTVTNVHVEWRHIHKLKSYMKAIQLNLFCPT